MGNGRLRRPGGDAASICLAGACAVHCLVAPTAAAMLPLAGLAMENPLVEWGLLLLSLGTSAFVLWRGCAQQHRRWLALLPFIVGACVVLAGRFAEETFPRLATAAIVAGAGTIVASHVLNIRWCRRAGAAHCADVPSIPVVLPLSRFTPFVSPDGAAPPAGDQKTDRPGSLAPAG